MARCSSYRDPMFRNVRREALLKKLGHPSLTHSSDVMTSSSCSYRLNGLEWAPPIMVVAVVTLFASTLDLMADFLVCSRIAEFLGNFQSQIAIQAAYGYFFFTGVSVFVYIFEMVDVCQTLKHEEENVFFARLAKSMVLALEESS
ncbi:hypothetical protein ANCCEY_00426 [Ancylostoma ceylanicum]|uniref:SSD domain-containing protein n=1 Tax=Ancylostoma ceylanicum TaxID=53326 RepID=A0A0D6M8P4_9BILA|nr:hypothetical protein ANCCEY_00426 [Ancylostoma ceylanicum]